jgi:hypothetical protein
VGRRRRDRRADDGRRRAVKKEIWIPKSATSMTFELRPLHPQTGFAKPS